MRFATARLALRLRPFNPAPLFDMVGAAVALDASFVGRVRRARRPGMAGLRARSAGTRHRGPDRVPPEHPVP